MGSTETSLDLATEDNRSPTTPSGEPVTPSWRTLTETPLAS
jgi:hypothetical protein